MTRNSNIISHRNVQLNPPQSTCFGSKSLRRILDEPTASLDAKAKLEIYRQFEQIAEGKQLSSSPTDWAWHIIVLNNGRIEEEETHAELLGRNGYYARMNQSQAQWYR